MWNSMYTNAHLCVLSHCISTILLRLSRVCIQIHVDNNVSIDKKMAKFAWHYKL